MNIKAFLGFMLFVLVTITLFVVAISLTRSNKAEELNRITLADHVNNESIAIYTVRGRIIAEEEHVGYKITISQNARNIQLLSGYDNKVISQKTYPNTKEAYEEFVFALDRTGFNNVNDTDTRGICASGSLYTYEFNQGQDKIAREWVTTCGVSSTKKFKPDFLFETQIPDFKELIREVRL